jgi:hypothetical protein
MGKRVLTGIKPTGVYMWEIISERLRLHWNWQKNENIKLRTSSLITMV